MAKSRPGVREQQRANTRQRLSEAAFELAEAEGVESLTADRIAARAGVSRRTFFNYVSSAEGALNIAVEDFLAFAYGAFQARPADEPLLASIVAVMSSADPALVAALERGAPFVRYHLEVWERDEVGISSLIASRLPPGAEPLFVRTLAAAVMGAGRAGVSIWAQEPAETRLPVNAYMIRAIQYLANLFPQAASQEVSRRRAKSTKTI
jgi:AcrR family transcriptional regulator